mmetsp:Transcript_3107/g.5401  ORF Transcript_3107/g.5401 Transcript_3107/m.5401 type:complete len:203 (-) Transcript_3107:596-1204(-)
MWNWLSRIKSNSDSVHHLLFSSFFSGLSHIHAHAGDVPIYLWRWWSVIWDIWRDLAYACNSSNWPVERLCSPWTASCSLRQERDWRVKTFASSTAQGKSRLVSSMVWVSERRRLSSGALLSDSAGLGKSPPFMGMRREEQNGQQQPPQQQLLMRRQHLQMVQQQQQQLRRVLKWQQSPKASSVRRQVQGPRRGMCCGQPRKR